LQAKKRDLSRFVKWPAYVRLQRQRRILYQRLKVPPAINQFRKPLDKAETLPLFKLLAKYKPETEKEKKARVRKLAEAKAAGGDAASSKPPPVIKFGLNHITYLIEQKKAKLVRTRAAARTGSRGLVSPAGWITRRLFPCAAGRHCCRR
jgi:large subunit ribosomal protein L7Ae